jgi:hypothetical protein
MMLRHMGWTEAADLIISSMEASIASKKVTYDFARLMDGATQVSCSGFGQVMIASGMSCLLVSSVRLRVCGKDFVLVNQRRPSPVIHAGAGTPGVRNPDGARQSTVSLE